MSVLSEDHGLKIRPISKFIGAEVTGVDLTQPVDDATRRALRKAVVDNVALVIRNQKFTPAQFATAAEIFGELMPDQIKTNLIRDLPMVSILSNFEKDSNGNQAKTPKNAIWHTDHTNKERPPNYTFLYAVEIPEHGGGTSVVNMNAAYEALPSDKRAALDTMKTANVRVSSALLATANPDTLAEQKRLTATPMMHPLIRTHPESGKKAIWFHLSKTESVTGMNAHETQDFLNELLQETIKPEFEYTHNWTLGDMLIVDNRSAMHKAGVDYDMSQHRMLYRTMVMGDRPY
ncbi:MAG: TauD/TfdA family dioxygenase [Alphaproteobacteria bacterium]|nr:TauD/TfdA family dioxygenase [Alphaproteobacteria bacterium]